MVFHRFMCKPLFAGSVDHRVREGAWWRISGSLKVKGVAFGVPLKGAIIGLPEGVL